MPKSSNDNDDIYKYLTYYLLTIPKLFDELPQILTSLDAGEAIGTSFIQDTSMRDALDHIMTFLPTTKTKGNDIIMINNNIVTNITIIIDGWIKSSSSSVIGHVFSKFLKDKVIVQPSSLSIRLSTITSFSDYPYHHHYYHHYHHCIVKHSRVDQRLYTY